jgi:predicted nicotinamide N-methyase
MFDVQPCMNSSCIRDFLHRGQRLSLSHTLNECNLKHVMYRGGCWGRGSACSSRDQRPVALKSSKAVFDSIVDVPCRVVDVPISETLTIPVVTADCDHVMEMYIQAGMDDRDPYWTCIWPSSQVLAREVLQSDPSIVQGKRVSDFGAGLGLAGVAAGLSGASDVVFLDREPLSLECCLLNAQVNGFDRSCMSMGFSGDNNVPHLSDIHVEHMARFNQSVPKTRLTADVFDWNEEIRAPHLHGYDTILACDVLYEKFSVEPIARVLPLLLRQKEDGGGKILIADPPNRAKANREKFIGLMACYGFQIERQETKIALEQTEAQGIREVPIVLLVLSR